MAFIAAMPVLCISAGAVWGQSSSTPYPWQNPAVPAAYPALSGSPPVPPYGLQGVPVNRFDYYGDLTGNPGCKPGHVKTFPGIESSMIVPAICPGPYQNVWPFGGFLPYTHMQRFVQRLPFPPLVFERLSSGPFPIQAPAAAAGTTGQGASSVYGEAPAELCPALKNPAKDSEPNDPKMVCSCTASYLRLVAAQAASMRAVNPEVGADSIFSNAYDEIAWVALQNRAGKPPGWKWRCDLLDRPAPAGAAVQALAPPVRPLPKLGESKADYAAEMQAYVKQWNDYQKQRQKQLAAAVLSGFHDKAYAAEIAAIPAVAYMSVMGALIDLWDMQETVSTWAVVAVDRRFVGTVDQAEFALWSFWADSQDLIQLTPGSGQSIQWVNMQEFIKQIQPACTEFDRTFNSGVDAAAASIREIAREVLDRHDLIVRDLKLWAEFAGRDGFPQVLADGKPEALGGFLALESFLFDDPRSLALHPAFFSTLRDRSMDYFQIHLGSHRQDFTGWPTEYWLSRPPCSVEKVVSFPAGFETDLYSDHAQRFMPGDPAAANAIAALDPDVHASLAFRLDVLKASSDVDVYASGADISEQP